MSSHSLLLTASGEVYAAGSNTSGCLGLGSAYTSYTTIPDYIRLPVTDISAVSHGTSTSFLLTRNHEVMSCGTNANGQLGLGNTTAQTDLSFVKADASTRLTNVAAVSTYDSHSVFLLTDGSALTCGLNTAGQLGDVSSNSQKTYPSAVLSAVATPLPKVISSVAAGASHTLLGATDGTAWSCGSNEKGQLGVGTVYGSSGSSSTITIGNASLINTVTKALWLSNDTAYMTMDGQNRISQWSDRSGNGKHATQSSDGEKPTYDSTTKSVVFNGSSQGFVIDLDFLAGTSHMAFILTKPTNFRPIYGAATVGGNNENRLHVGFATSTQYVMNYYYNDFMPNTTSNYISADFNLVSFKWIPGTSKTIFANSLEEGTNSSAGVIGTMSGGGRIGLNVVGSGYFGGSITEIIFLTGTDITESNINIVNSYMMKKINDNYRTISLFPQPQLYTNYTLQIKTGESTNLSDVSRVVAGGNHSLALTSTGNVYSWGENTAGQLGRNNNTDATYASLVLTAASATLANIAQVAAGANHSLFLTTTGTVFACGLNTSGQLGNNSTTSSNQLVSVLNPAGTAALSGITRISARGNTSFFLASDGTLYACGSNAQSQMGFANSGATTYYVLPVQLSVVDFGKVKTAGYSARDARLLGFEPWQQQYYGEPIFNISSSGYSSTDLSNSGISVGTLKSAGLTSSQAAFLGFSDEQAYPPSFITSTGSLAASAAIFTRRSNGNFAQALNSTIHNTKFYDMSASSHFLSGDSVDLPPSAFSSTHTWRSELLWNTSTGAYTGSKTTTMSGTSYSGEWIQIQLPVAIRLSSYSFMPSASRTPAVFYLGGSTDGITWTLLDSKNTATTGGSVNRFTVSAGGLFNYYRLVVNAIQAGNDGYLAMSRFQLNTTGLPSRDVMSVDDLTLAGYDAVQIISAGKSINNTGVSLPTNSGYTVKQLVSAGLNYGDIVRNTGVKLVKVGQPSLTAANIGSLMEGAILDPPKSLSATDRDASSISVAIVPPSFNSGLTGYSVDAVPVTGGSTVSKSLGVAGTLVDGLVAGKIYDLRVRSVNAAGSSTVRVFRNSTTLGNLPTLTVGSITGSGMTITFGSPLPTTQDCSYVLRTIPNKFQIILTAGSTSQVLSRLDSSTNYTIILDASNIYTTSSVTVSATTGPPPPPPPVAGYSLWLDSNDPSVYDLSGSNVTRWNDKSSNAKHMTLRIGPGPTLSTINSKTIFDFTSTTLTDFLNEEFVMPESYTIFCVGYTPNTVSNYGRLLTASGDENSSIFFFGRNGTNFTTFVGNGTNWNDINANSPSESVTSLKVLGVTNNDSASGLIPYVNGTQQNVKNASTVPFTGLRVAGGYTGQAQPWGGYIGEVIIYFSVLSTTDRQSVENYLKAKWGIT